MLMAVPDQGKLKWLTWAANIDTGSFPDWTLRLFQNNITPNDSTVVGDFTEATFTGYASVSILRSQMGTPVITSHIAITTRSSAPSFSCTGGSPQTCYGWYLTSNDDGHCLCAQVFDTPRVMSAGSTENIDPFQIELKAFA